MAKKIDLSKRKHLLKWKPPRRSTGSPWPNLLAKKSKKAKKAAAPPKYAHPENKAVTWSGRGRQPAWYKEAIAKGKSPKQLSI